MAQYKKVAEVYEKKSEGAGVLAAIAIIMLVVFVLAAA